MQGDTQQFWREIHTHACSQTEKSDCKPRFVVCNCLPEKNKPGLACKRDHSNEWICDHDRAYW